MGKQLSINDLTGGTEQTITSPTDTASNAVIPADAGDLTPIGQSGDPYATLDETDRLQVDRLAAGIDLTRPDIASTYGTDVQNATSGFADQILSETRAKDAGDAGKLLSDMLETIDDANLNGIRNIPIIGQIATSVGRLRRRYQKVSGQIDDIVAELEKARARLVSDISMYDTMYERNAKQYHDIRLTVIAGRRALDAFNREQMPGLEKEAQSGDPMKAQILKDFKTRLERFEKRLDDLGRLGVVSLQTAPQIRIIQNADQQVVDKIGTTISTTVPVWKAQTVIALGLENQRNALDLQNRADDLTNKLLTANAEALHQGAVAAEQANQRSVVDIETLEKVNSELISTLRETIRIQREGRANREQARERMRGLENDLKNALIENAQAL